MNPSNSQWIYRTSAWDAYSSTCRFSLPPHLLNTLEKKSRSRAGRIAMNVFTLTPDAEFDAGVLTLSISVPRSGPEENSRLLSKIALA